MSDTFTSEQKSPASNTPAEVTSSAAAPAARVTVKTQAGVVHVVEGSTGMSLMEAIRNAGISELPAYCGGNCSCATCHVHVAPEWQSRLPAMADDEDTVLQGAPARDKSSRLSCQIPFTEQLNGLEVVIAEME